MSGVSLVIYSMIFAASMTICKGHSWLNCVDYLHENGMDYDHGLCRAYIRSGSRYTPNGGTFGADVGADHRPGENNPCQSTRNDATSYDAQHPMAVYFQGQRIIVAHPMKNHGADTRCTSKFIPDNGNFIYRGEKDAATDPTLSVFRQNLVVDLGISPFGNNVPDTVTQTYPKIGYQNAPKFCENTDKSLATNFFVLPNLEPGRYTFVWVWAFNGVADLYSTCWEADVVATRAERDAVLQGRGQSVSDPVDVLNTNPTSPPSATAAPGGDTPGGAGQWTAWSPWSPCSITCGTGFERRVRDCTSSTCSGNGEELRSCSSDCEVTDGAKRIQIPFILLLLVLITAYSVLPSD